MKEKYTLSFEKYFQNVDSDWQALEYAELVKNNKIVTGIVPAHVDETEKDLSDGGIVRYKKDNVSVEDGKLILKGIKDENGYAGATVKLLGRKFGNGCLEVKAKFPEYMPGVWPRMTLKGKKDIVNTQIVFAQVMGIRGKNACSLLADFTDEAGAHSFNYLYSRNNSWPRFYPDAQSDELLAGGWHIFAYEQTENDAIFYVDGKEFCRIDIDHPVFSAFGTEGELYLSLGLNLPRIEACDDNTVLPCQMEVEYIKFYEEVK